MGLPKNFAIEYTFSNGSMPPPHHYETAVRLTPAREATYEFRPGYPGLEAGAQLWKAAFPVSTSQRVELYQKLLRLGIEKPWTNKPSQKVGGPSRVLTVVTAKGKVVLREPDSGTERERFLKMIEAVAALVPAKYSLKFEMQFQALSHRSGPSIR